MNSESENAKRRRRYAEEMKDPVYRVRVGKKRSDDLKRSRAGRPRKNANPIMQIWAAKFFADYNRKPSPKEYHNFWMGQAYKKRSKCDPEYRVIHSLRVRISRSVGSKRPEKTKDILGCSPRELREHLESLFKPGMSWENYGVKGWHIDHKRPLASFRLVNESGSMDAREIRRAMHFTNLQPLWYWENQSKGSKFSQSIA